MGTSDGERLVVERVQTGVRMEKRIVKVLKALAELYDISGPRATSEDFVARHPDLLTWKPSILDRYYRPETLGSEIARRVFVMPDRAA